MRRFLLGYFVVLPVVIASLSVATVFWIAGTACYLVVSACRRVSEDMAKLVDL